jgi:hypothetical protein
MAGLAHDRLARCEGAGRSRLGLGGRAGGRHARRERPDVRDKRSCSYYGADDRLRYIQERDLRWNGST